MDKKEQKAISKITLKIQKRLNDMENLWMDLQDLLVELDDTISTPQ